MWQLETVLSMFQFLRILKYIFSKIMCMPIQPPSLAQFHPPPPPKPEEFLLHLVTQFLVAQISPPNFMLHGLGCKYKATEITSRHVQFIMILNSQSNAAAYRYKPRIP